MACWTSATRGRRRLGVGLEAGDAELLEPVPVGEVRECGVCGDDRSGVAGRQPGLDVAIDRVEIVDQSDGALLVRGGVVGVEAAELIGNVGGHVGQTRRIEPEVRVEARFDVGFVAVSGWAR